MNDRESRSQTTRPLDGDALEMDLAGEVRAARASAAMRAAGAHTAVTLLKRADQSVVLLVLAAGARVHKHRASGSVTVHALEGRVQLRLGERTVKLAAGQLVAFGPGIEHDVQADVDSAVLLTLARSAAP